MPISKSRSKPERKKRKKSEPKWEGFERIVAAIHLAETQGATVTWDEKIEGRQFDVTIRFKVGFYEYLTLIECRDYNKAVQVEKVEAFVTKARHHKANKAIMVSAYGFQSGAKKVARRENIELYSLRQINKLPEDMLTDIFLSFVVVRPVAFRYNGEPAFIFSGDPNILQYQLENIRFTNYGDLNIAGLIRPFTQLVYPTPLPGVPDVEKVGFPFKRATATPVKSGWRMMDNTKLIIPNSGEEVPVSEFLFIYWAETARLLNLGGLDPTVFASFGRQYEYKNELTNEVTLIDPVKLAMGVNTNFEEGKFYTQPQLNNFIYYCEKIEGEFATILLLKSYQHGQLVRMQVKEALSSSKAYIEITEEKDIECSKELYEEFVEHRKRTPPQASSDGVMMWFS
jgi:Restriction endonuclease